MHQHHHVYWRWTPCSCTAAQALEVILHWTQIRTSACAEMFSNGIIEDTQLPFVSSVARLNLKTESPLTTRGRQKRKKESSLGRFLAVLPGRNRTKRGMKWNCGHPEVSLSHSGPGGKSTEEPFKIKSDKLLKTGEWRVVGDMTMVRITSLNGFLILNRVSGCEVRWPLRLNS